MSYCNFCKNLPDEDRHKIYHDHHYGFPIPEDDELFGRLILEIMQAGLSWNIILKKEPHFREAFDEFSIDRIAEYDEEKINSLLANQNIIRNVLKIRSVIHNAQQVKMLQDEYGTFNEWIYLQDAKDKIEWVKIFKKKFKFVGGEIVNEFLMSIGVLKGAHQEDCPVFEKQLKTYQKWKEHE
ncbi:MAG: DNA-3-methyladenine glycosylase I [Flavobacteriia bacterium]|nr:DNA-3-methyladenine glycosylase I [Flavobacteriia bacterium]OJX39273.1 MAG: DNA-3-methyladenine glycosylase [Flavobacteriia bacterium 40-80]